MQIDLTKLPTNPGVYQFKDKDSKILYIGKAKNLQKRVSQYFAKNSLRKAEMLKKAQKVDFLIVSNEGEALYLENNLIKQYKPFYNTLLKWWNWYTYIRLSPDQFPQVILTRNKRDDGATYIWPKRNSQELKKLMQYLRMILKFRTCPISQFRQGKLCSDFNFGLCEWYCQFPKNNSNSPDFIQPFTSFFRWNTKPIEKEIKNQIQTAIQTQNFERAAKLRDIFLHIEQMVERQTVELDKKITWYVMEIRKISDYRVFVVLNFYEGRLIDVIRDKISIDEWDPYHLLANLAADIDDTFSIQSDSWKDNWLIALTTKIKLNKTEKADILAMLDRFFESFLLSTTFEANNLNNDLLKLIQSRYHLANFPNRIECVDISHLGGSRRSGGLSGMEGWLLEKKFYRRYKIRSETSGSDDYSALEEVILRRFEHSSIPNLFILDWWKGQLNVIKKIYDEKERFRDIFHSVDFISLGKWEARKKSWIGWRSKRWWDEVITEKIYRFDKNWHIDEILLHYDQADKLLTKLRDEAHRFSNAYRKKQMSQEFK